jgi:hypothetical protein
MDIRRRHTSGWPQAQLVRGLPGYIGFAQGRTSFRDALVDWRANRIA